MTLNIPYVDDPSIPNTPPQLQLCTNISSWLSNSGGRASPKLNMSKPKFPKPFLIHPKLPSQLSRGSITLPGAWLSLCSFLPHQGLREPLSALLLETHQIDHFLPPSHHHLPQNCSPIFPTSHLFLVPPQKFSTEFRVMFKSMNKIMTRSSVTSYHSLRAAGSKSFPWPCELHKLAPAIAPAICLYKD